MLLAQLFELLFLFIRQYTEHLLVLLLAQSLYFLFFLVIAQRVVLANGDRLLPGLLTDLFELLFLRVSQVQLLSDHRHVLPPPLHSSAAPAALVLILGLPGALAIVLVLLLR